MSNKPTINIIDLGKMPYLEALELQKKYHQEVVDDLRGDTLLLVEHPPVLTMGKRGDKKNLLVSEVELQRLGVPIIDIERGGDITYHGPGQIVGYPIINLRRVKIKVKDYVDGLEEMLINMLKEHYGVTALKEPGKYTGVWVDGKKIMAIGVEIKRKVTMHGFAVNVNTNMSHFEWIVPCGLEGRQATSLEQVMGNLLDMTTVKKELVDAFLDQFQLQEI